jgi:NADH dehydrogenase/NADH:ubiquinone oxidoreductase subunit G
MLIKLNNRNVGGTEMKKSNKIILAIVFMVTFLTASLHSYASNVLGTDLISLIKFNIFKVEAENGEAIEDYFDQKEQEQKTDLADHVNQKNNEANEAINEAKENGISEKEAELNAYLEQLKAEIDAIYAQETQQAIDHINGQLDQETLRIKQQLLKELEAMYNR